MQPRERYHPSQMSFAKGFLARWAKAVDPSSMALNLRWMNFDEFLLPIVFHVLREHFSGIFPLGPVQDDILIQESALFYDICHDCRLEFTSHIFNIFTDFVISLRSTILWPCDYFFELLSEINGRGLKKSIPSQRTSEIDSNDNSHFQHKMSLVMLEP